MGPILLVRGRPAQGAGLQAYVILIRAYLDRSKQLPELLSKQCLDHDENEHGSADLMVFPPLFFAAVGAGYLAPTNVMIGLIVVHPN